MNNDSIIWGKIYLENVFATIYSRHPKFINNFLQRFGDPMWEMKNMPRSRFYDLLDVIQFSHDDYKNHDQIVNHIDKNEHKHIWWLL